MELDLREVVAQISRDKGIDKTVLIKALEEAIQIAAKRVFGGNRELEARFNEQSGHIDLFQYVTVADDVADPEREIPLDKALLVDPETQPGDELGFQIFYRDEDRHLARSEEEKYGDILGIAKARGTFGRIAAQAAKQVITQRVRTAEREIVFNDYKGRKHELVTGIARRFERGDIVVDLGRAEALLPVREQIPKESYRAGDRVQAFVLDVLDSEHSLKGSQIILSRRHPFLVIKLFEVEVPEIYEGIVKIVSVAREPGERTKIAVTSTDSDVDPVGACVGMRGARVQAVVQELKGEKIDIVPYSPDLGKLVCNAIAPAEVSRVLIDEDKNSIELVVPDDQLSLAIGRRGQNVKLASQLVGWDIEIHSEAQVGEQKEEIKKALVGDGLISEMDLDYLFKLGLHSIDAIMETSESELLSMPGLNDSNLDRIMERLAALKIERERRREENLAAERQAAINRRMEVAAQITQEAAMQAEVKQDLVPEGEVQQVQEEAAPAVDGEKKDGE